MCIRDRFQDEGIDTIFLPFFSQNGEKWIMTTPYFQVALNRDLEQDTARREKAMKVLNVMLSEEAQSRIVADGQDLLSYSQNVPLRLTDYMKDVRDVVEENHMYIRIASNDFFAISKDVVSKMIAGEYTAKQAYRAFNAQLLAEEEPAADETVLTSGKSYSNVFHANGGNAAFSVMANTLRGVYGTDVLLATANSFTGSVLKADYTPKMADSMIMPNGLMSRQRTMTGAELKGLVRAYVEGCEGGFVPFNRGSLPIVSGIAVEVKEASGSYTLTGITRNGQPLRDDDTVTVTCLAAEKQMEALLASESGVSAGEDTWVKNTWRDHVSGGGDVYKRQGICCAGKTARQMTRRDYETYDYLIAMDRNNLRNMVRFVGSDPEHKVSLLMDHTSRPGDVADPWYTGDFEATWQDVLEGCTALLEELR